MLSGHLSGRLLFEATDAASATIVGARTAVARSSPTVSGPTGGATRVASFGTSSGPSAAFGRQLSVVRVMHFFQNGGGERSSSGAERRCSERADALNTRRRGGPDRHRARSGRGGHNLFSR